MRIKKYKFKKMLALVFLGFFSLAFFATISNALADTTSCSKAGGHCVSGSCPSGEAPLNGVTCDDGKICCVASKSEPGDESGIIKFVNPLEYDTVEDVLYSLLNTLQGIIVVISIIFIIIGAILYITSTGDEKKITMAKAAITASMIGLAIGIAAPSFLREISDILGWKSSNVLEACDINDNGTIDAGAEQACVDALEKSLTLAEIALNTLNFLLSVVGVLAIIMLVWGGIMYLTAAGDEKRIETAKNIVKWAIIGIAIALAAMVITRQIATFFS